MNKESRYITNSHNPLRRLVHGALVTTLLLCGGTAIAQSHVTVGGNVYGGGNKANVSLNSSVDIEQAGAVINADVYGGGALANVGTSNENLTKVTLNKGTVKGNVYGGGLGDADHAALVKGKVDVSVQSGGTVTNNVFGCNNLNGAPQDEVKVHIYGGSVTNVFGGGNQAAYAGTPEVRVSGGTIDTVFGGGNEASVGGGDIEVSGGTIAKGIYGGCNTRGTVLTDTRVSLTGGTIGRGFTESERSTYLSYTDTSVQNAYMRTFLADNAGKVHGGGYGYETSVAGNVLISIPTNSTATIWGDIYGGSALGNVNTNSSNTTTVSIQDGTIHGNVYGGGLGNAGHAAKVFGVVTVNVGSVDNTDPENPVYSGNASFAHDIFRSCIFGSNNINGSAQDNVYVNIYATAHTEDDKHDNEASNATYAIYQVFGGGNRANYAPENGDANSNKTSYVHVYGCENTIQEIFGGSNAADAQAINLVVDGGRHDYVFGGGNGILSAANVLNSTYSRVKGGHVGWYFGGSNRLGTCNGIDDGTEEGGLCGEVQIDYFFNGGNMADQYGDITLNLTCVENKKYKGVYGGCRLGSVYGNITVNITGGKFTNVFGGCRGASDFSADVKRFPTKAELEADAGHTLYTDALRQFIADNGGDSLLGKGGDIIINIYGGDIDNVYGGCDIRGNVEGLITINIDSTKQAEGHCELKLDYVYGGSNEAQYSPIQPAAVSPNHSPLINLKRGSVNQDVFGGGKGNSTDYNSGLVTSHPKVNMTFNNNFRIGHNIYGGGELGQVDNSTTIEVSNGTINGSIYGGGKGDNTRYEFGRIKENTNISISGGEVKGSVYGGGELASVGTISNAADTATTAKHTDTASSFALSWPYNFAYAANTGTANINITGGKINNIYGGGKGLVADRYKEAHFANVVNTNITINFTPDANNKITGDVYGGGENGHVNNNTVVTLTHGSIEGNLFGGGKGTDTYTGKLKNNDTDNEETLQIHSLIAGKVYGNTHVTINDGTVEGSVFGGGNLASVGKGNYAKYGEKLVPGDTANTGRCYVDILGGTIGTDGVGNGNVFGSSKGVAFPSNYKMPIFDYNRDFYMAYVNKTFVTIGTQGSATGPSVKGSVYGGGDNGHVRYDTYVQINSGAVGYDLTQAEYDGHSVDPTTGDWAYRGNVFGAGRGLDFIEGTTDYCYSAGSVTRNTRVDINGGKVYRNIYGGGDLASVGSPAGFEDETSICIININDTIGASKYTGKVNNINYTYFGGYVGGGSRGMASPDATVDGKPFHKFEEFATCVNTQVNINGYVRNTVYGGGEFGQVLGNTEVNIIGGKVRASVYGGGKGSWQDNSLGGGTYNNDTISGRIKGNTTVNLLAGEVQYVYGGSSRANSWGNATVNIGKADLSNSGTKFIWNKYGYNVFGCNQYVGSPYGDVTVNVYKSAHADSNLYPTTSITDSASLAANSATQKYAILGIYGGGYQASYTPKVAGHKTTVHVYNCNNTIGDIFGGGYSAQMGTTGENGVSADANVIIDGGRIRRVFGGGNGTGGSADIYGTATTTIHAGLIDTVFGGCNKQGTITASITNIDHSNTTSGCDEVIRSIFGGSNEADGNSGTLTIACGNGIYSFGEVYGGSHKASSTGDVVLTINGGTIANVYAGSKGVAGNNAIDAQIDGNVELNLHGGTIGNAFGGSNAKGNISGSITVNVEDNGDCPLAVTNVYGAGNLASYEPTNGTILSPEVNIYHATIGRSVFGGGLGSSAIVKANPKVTIGDNNADHKVIVTNNVYGGGYAAAVDGNTSITYEDNNALSSVTNLFGGGNEAGVSGMTTVNMTLGKVTNGIYGGCNTSDTVGGDINVNVYGGTLGADGSPLPGGIYGGGYGEETSTKGDVTVNIGTEDGSYQPTIYSDVYGGSALGSVNNGNTDTTKVNFLNGTIHGNLYGGGLGQSGTGNANKGMVDGVVELNIGSPDQTSNTVVMDGDVYGCNNTNGSPQYDVYVNIYKTAHDAKNAATYTESDRTYAISNVFGGGHNATYAPRNADNHATVHVYNCDNTIEDIFGGGDAADAYGVATIIEGGRFKRIFGGGNGEVTEANIGAGGASLTVKAGRIGQLFGGSNETGTISGPVSTIVNHDNGDCPEVIDEFYSGSNLADITGDIETTIECGVGTIYEIYGGSNMADITGNVTLNIKGGEFTYVYGGSKGRAADPANSIAAKSANIKDNGTGTKGNVTLNLYGGTIANAFGGSNINGNIDGIITVKVEENSSCPLAITDIYGAGNQTAYTPSNSTAQSPLVNINHTASTSSITGDVYGGGLGAPAVVTANPVVTIGDAVQAHQALVGGNVYGGGALANVNGNPTVLMQNSNTLVSGDIYGGGALADVKSTTVTINGGKANNNVYGGGHGQTTPSSIAAQVDGDVQVTINSGSVSGAVYGANNLNGAPTGDITVDVYGTDQPTTGYAIGSIFGGGNQSAYTKIPKVTVHNCDNKIEYVYGGGNAASVKGTDVTIYGGNAIGNVYGGCYGADVTTNGTKVNIYGGTIGSVFGGNNASGSITGDILVNVEKRAESSSACEMHVSRVYGGGNHADSKAGNINIGCTGGETEGIDTVYGGANQAIVSGDIELKITGGHINNVFGGNNTSGNITGSITVNVNWDNSCVHNYLGNVYGGGNLASYTPTDTTILFPKVNIINGTVSHNVYGGGYGIDTETKKGIVNANPIVTIGDNNPNHTVNVLGNVIGGGALAQVVGNTKVNIVNGTVEGSVFGGGEGSESNMIIALVMKNAEVNMTGGRVKQSVYGGGKVASVGYFSYDENAINPIPDSCKRGTGNTLVAISGGTVGPDVLTMPDFTGHVFGGCMGVIGDTTASGNPNILNLAYSNTTDVTISGTAFIKGSVYGGSENGRVLDSTYVKIQGGQIGCGEGSTTPYTEDQFIDPRTTTVTNSNALAECPHWPFSGDNQSYDKFANESGYDAKGGAVNATDGHTFYGNVFGGGSGVFPYAAGKWIQSAGRVYGNSRVEISGGHVLTSVYGGCEVSDVFGDAYVEMRGGTLGVPRTLAQIKAHPVTCYLFGAGKGDQRIFFNTWTNVENATVKVLDGAIVYGSVFGGGEDGHVHKNVNIVVDGSTTLIGTWGTSYVDGNIFGGGRGFSGDALTAGSVGGNVTIDIHDGLMLGSVYGGGRLASIGTAFANVSDPLYGKMQDGANHGYVTINITGGTIGTESVFGAERPTHLVTGNVFGGSMGRLTLNNGSINSIWPDLGKVKNTEINISGNTVIRSSVFGGSELGSVTGDTKINVTGKNVKIGTTKLDNSGNVLYRFGSVIGGGYGTKVTDLINGTPSNELAGRVFGNTEVNISEGTVANNVLGGGKMAYVGTDTNSTLGNTTVNIGTNEQTSNSVEIGNGIFGANDSTGSPLGNTNVHIYLTNHTVANTRPADSAAFVAAQAAAKADAEVAKSQFALQAVYGGGNLANYTPLAGKSTNVYVHNCSNTIKMLYGGGRAADAGTSTVPANTSVTVEGGRIDTLFGGGDGHLKDASGNYLAADIWGDANATVNGGYYTAVFGGSNTAGGVKGTKNLIVTKTNVCDQEEIVDNIFGGDNQADGSGGTLTIDCGAGYCSRVFGGSNAANVTGDITVNIKGGTIDTVFGGNNSSGNIKGDIAVNLYGGKLGYIFGGSNLGDTVIGRIVINIDSIQDEDNCPLTIANNVYGGGHIAPTIASDRSYISPIVNIKHGTVGLPSVTADATHGNVFGGGYGIGSRVLTNPKVVIGNGTYTGDGAIADKPVVMGNIYGGGQISHIFGSTTVEIVDGTVKGSVFAAGKGVDDLTDPEASTRGQIDGHTSLTMSGGQVWGNLYGGGELATVGHFDDPSDSKYDSETSAAKKLYGLSTVTISGGQVGREAEVGNAAQVAAGTHREAGHTWQYKGHIYGGGHGRAGANWLSFAKVDSAYVNIAGGYIVGSVFGGGESGHTLRSTVVEMSGGTVGQPLELAERRVDEMAHGMKNYVGNVYGAGRGIDTDENGNYSHSAGRVYGNTSVTITGGTVRHAVFGGGSLASVGTYDEVNISTSEAPVWRHRYTEGTGKTSVTVKGNALIGPKKDDLLSNNAATQDTNFKYLGGNEGWVYGGSRGISGSLYSELAFVHSTEVVVEGNAQVVGAVFGGGEDGHIKYSTDVKVQGNAVVGGIPLHGNTYTITNGEYAGVTVNLGDNQSEVDRLPASNNYRHIYRGNVYGGGRGVDHDDIDENLEYSYSAGKVYGNTSVTIDGDAQIYNSVFGGGSIATVGTYDNVEDPHNATDMIIYNDPAVMTHTGLAKVLIKGGTIGTTGHNNGHVYGGCRGIAAGVTDNEGGEAIHLSFVDSTYVNVSNGSVKGSVYGGGANGHVLQNTCVNITGGTIGYLEASNAEVGNVFGGGRGEDSYYDLVNNTWSHSRTAGLVFGNANTNISAGQVYGSVYGGGELGSVNKNSYVTVSGGTIGHVNYYNKSAEFYSDDEHAPFPTFLGHVYGAGKGIADEAFKDFNNVTNTDVNITAGRIYGSVYGGSANGHVTGTTNVKVNGGTIGTKGVSSWDGHVFGGGEGSGHEDDNENFVFHPSCGRVEGNTNVTFSNGYLLGTIYGGGRLALTGVDGNGNYATLVGTGEGATYDTVKHGLATVVVTGGTIGNSDGDTLLASDFSVGDIFGSGRGDVEYYESVPAGRVANAHVTVSGSPIIHGAIFGGGEMAGVGWWDNDGKFEPKTGTSVVDVSGGIIGSELEYTKDYLDAHMEDTTDWTFIVDGKLNHACTGNIIGGSQGDIDITCPSWISMGRSRQTYVKISGDVHVMGNVYGGAEQGVVTENTHVEVSGGTIGTTIQVAKSVAPNGYYYYGSVFGGGYGTEKYWKHENDSCIYDGSGKIKAYTSGTMIAGRVYGNTNVKVTGGNIYENVYGGGNMASVGYVDRYYHTTGDSLVIEYLHDSTKWHNGVCTVTIGGNAVIGSAGLDGTELNGEVYGAGKGVGNDQGKHFNNYCNVNYTDLKVNGGFINGSTFGGGADCHVLGHAKTLVEAGANIGSGQIDETDLADGYSGYEEEYDGCVIGGGRNAQNINHTAGRVQGNTYIKVTGGRIKRSVIGGGALARTGVDVNGLIETFTVAGVYDSVHHGSTFVDVSGDTVVLSSSQFNNNIYKNGKTYKEFFSGTTVPKGNDTIVYLTTIGAPNGSILVDNDYTIGDIFGGGKGDTKDTVDIMAGRVMNTYVKVHKYPRIMADIYAGAEMASVGWWDTNRYVGTYKDSELNTNHDKYVAGTGYTHTEISDNPNTGTPYEFSTDNYITHRKAWTLVDSIGRLTHTCSGNVYGGGQGYVEEKATHRENWVHMGRVRNTSVTISGGTFMGNVFGGGSRGVVKEDCTVTINGGRIGCIIEDNSKNKDGSDKYHDGRYYYGSVFGGGYGNPKKFSHINDSSFVTTSGKKIPMIPTEQAGRVYGNTHVYIKDGHIMDCVYGGGDLASTGYVGRNSETGAYEFDKDESRSGGICYVEMSGGEVGPLDYNGHNAYVYGAGRGVGYDPSEEYKMCANVNETHLTVKGGKIWGSTFGGGSDAHVLGDVHTKVTTGADLGTRGTTSYDGNIFGAGRNYLNTNHTNGRVQGNIHVLMDGGTIKGTIFGGGRMALSGVDFVGHFIDSLHGNVDIIVCGNATIGTDNSADLLIAKESCGDIFGAGKGDTKNYKDIWAGRVTNTKITVKDSLGHSPRIYGGVFGGGEMASVGWWDDTIKNTDGSVKFHTDGTNGTEYGIFYENTGKAVISITGGVTIGTYDELTHYTKPTHDLKDRVYAEEPYENPGEWTMYNTDGTVFHTATGNVYGGCQGDINTEKPRWVSMGRSHTSRVTIGNGNDNPVIMGCVFGGSEQGIMTGNTHVTINSGTIGTDVTTGSGATKHYTYGDVYAAGYGCDEEIDWDNTAVNDSTAASQALGIGWNPGLLAGRTFGDSRVDILGGTVKGSVYGGGCFASVGDDKPGFTANGNTQVNIGSKAQSSNTVVILGSVYGANNNKGSIYGDSHVDIWKTYHVTSGEGINDTSSAATAYAITNVYGAGNQADYVGNNCRANIHIHNCDNTVKNVFGGGNAAVAPASNVIVDGGRIDTLFVGGNGQVTPAHIGYLADGTTAITGDGDAKAYIYGGKINYLFGGSNSQGAIRGGSNITLDTTDGTHCKFDVEEFFGGGNEADGGGGVINVHCGTKFDEFYGGANNANISGDITLNIYGGVFTSIYGGSKGTTTEPADIDGNVTVNFYGGHVENLFGGSNINGNITGLIEVNVDIDPDYSCKDGLNLDYVYGAGHNASYTPLDPFRSSPTVNIMNNRYKTAGGDSAFVEITDVFGSGLGASAATYSYPHVIVGGFGTMSKTVNETPVTIYRKVWISGNIYGGGSAAPVYGNTYVAVRDAVVGTTEQSLQNGMVFGGGLGSTAIIDGNTHVGVFGLSDIKSNVYGGGNAGIVYGNTDVQIGYEQAVLTPEIIAYPDENGALKVRIETSTPDATIRYTLDGSTPNENSPVYSTPFDLRWEDVIQAVAYKDGMTPSLVAIDVAPAPRIIISDDGMVSFSTTVGTQTRYTLNGDNPTSSSTPYGGVTNEGAAGVPFHIGEGQVVRAIAEMRGCKTSSVAYLTAPAPEITIEGGSCTITGVAGSRILYTIDGSTPTSDMVGNGTADHGTLAGSTVTFSVTSGTTVKALVEKDGYMPSLISATIAE